MSIEYLGDCDFAQTHDFTKLGEMLEPVLVPEYFASISVATTLITCNDAEENEVLSIAYLSGQLVLQANIHTGSSITKSATSYCPSQLYRCKHGVLLRMNASISTNFAYLLITKNQNGKTVVVLPNLTTSSGTTIATTSTTNIAPICWDDSATATFSFSRAAFGNYQTLLTPFITTATIGERSFTPDAFWIPFYQYSEFGKLTIDGVDYLHTGYWAIRDEGAQ